MSATSIITAIAATLTLLSHLLIFLFIISLFRKKWRKQTTTFLKRNAILSGFLVSFLAVGMSLYYSELASYEPCRLCWYQRIFIYPQVIIFGAMLWKKTKDMTVPIILSAFGGLIAAYHYYIQIMAITVPGYSDSCSATGVSCVSTHLLEYSYITIPLMALTAFALILIIAIFGRK